jgi:hypothetical protein
MHKTKIAKRVRPDRKSNVRKAFGGDHDLVELAAQSKAHEWLRSDTEDIYSLEDGRTASWPKRPTNEAA